MRKLRNASILMLVLVLAVGCATLKQKYEAATPIEKASFWIDQFQKTLNVSLKMGAIYVDAHPDLRPMWKEKGIATSKIVQKILDDFTNELAAGKEITPSTIIMAVSSKLNEIVVLVNSWGIKISEYETLKFLIELEGGTV
jgi:hypothetical protein